jgi:aminoglycoside N3'-acetyltransferase
MSGMTRSELLALLDHLDLRGNQLVAHVALSSLGQVDGGARTFCEALIEAVGERGTILMPAFTCREVMQQAAGPDQPAPQAFHPDLPVSRELGVVAEAFRRLPGVIRSNHPTHSFAAWGRQARDVLSTQRDNNPLGPLKKLNLVQGYVLLIGTSLQAATAIHLAEEQAPLRYLQRCTAVRVNAAGYDERVVLEQVPGCSVAFGKLEPRLDPTKVCSVALPQGAARKIPIRYLVQLATKLLEADSAAFICDDPACAGCAPKREAVAAADATLRA